MQLPVADVERDHARGAALEQHVGEPAGRGADVERSAAPSASTPNASSACASFSPPRRDVRRRRVSTSSSASSSTCSRASRSPGTRPAMTSACACARVSASPRSTSRTSSRFFTRRSLVPHDTADLGPGRQATSWCLVTVDVVRQRPTASRGPGASVAARSGRERTRRACRNWRDFTPRDRSTLAGAARSAWHASPSAKSRRPAASTTLARGNRAAAIVLDDLDRQRFLRRAAPPSSSSYDWRCGSFCLMTNRPSPARADAGGRRSQPAMHRLHTRYVKSVQPARTTVDGHLVRSRGSRRRRRFRRCELARNRCATIVLRPVEPRIAPHRARWPCEQLAARPSMGAGAESLSSTTAWRSVVLARTERARAALRRASSLTGSSVARAS